MLPQKRVLFLEQNLFLVQTQKSIFNHFHIYIIKFITSHSNKLLPNIIFYR